MRALLTGGSLCELEFDLDSILLPSFLVIFVEHSLISCVMKSVEG